MARNLKFTIKSGRKTQCDLDHKIIRIHPRTKLINKIFLLAHELGHAITLKKCINYWGAEKVCAKITHDRLETELIAWEKADAIMKEINLYNENYLKAKHKYLKTYYLNYKRN